jgi:hypothetical protein
MTIRNVADKHFAIRYSQKQHLKRLTRSANRANLLTFHFQLFAILSRAKPGQNRVQCQADNPQV